MNKLVENAAQSQASEVYKDFRDSHSDVIKSICLTLKRIPQSKNNIQAFLALVEEAVVSSYMKGYEANSGKSEVVIDGVEYIDLGLPSGTLWSKVPVGEFNYDDASKMNIPTKEQFKELCECRFDGYFDRNGKHFIEVLAPSGATLEFSTKHHASDDYEEARCWVKNGDNISFGLILPAKATLGSVCDNGFPGYKYECWLVKSPEKEIEYIDLGLPSGTLWAKESLSGKKSSGKLSDMELPTSSQFQELISCCKVDSVVERRDGRAGTLKLVGPNGNFILFNIENHFSDLEWMAWNHYDGDADYLEEMDSPLPKECSFWICTHGNFSRGEISNKKEFGRCVVLNYDFNEALEVRLVKHRR